MKPILFSILVAFAFSSFADYVIFETVFEELPSGWHNDRWTFNNPGAKAQHYSVDEFWECDMSSSLYPPQVYYFVPDGADSVVVHIEHILSATTDEGSASGQVFMSSTTIGGGVIYDEGVFWYSSITDSEPIIHSIIDPPDGTYLGFHFHAVADAASYEYASINWKIFSMVVTAYGSAMELQSGTWAGIKSVF